MDAYDIWITLQGLFDKDDGSLPEIELSNLTSKHIEEIYLYLKNQGQDITIKGAHFWDKTIKQFRPIFSVDNAATMVVNYSAQPFHMVIGSLKYNGIIIPPIGVFIFQESISLDYRKGDDWNQDTVSAFLRLLYALNKIAPEMQVSLQKSQTQEAENEFQAVWQKFKLENHPD